MPGATWNARLCGLKRHWGKPLLLPLSNGTQESGPASAPYFLRERTAYRDKHRPSLAPPQQLGFRKGVSDSLRISRCPLFRRRFSSLFRGKETGEEPMDELFWHRRAHHPYALPKFVQRMEREILQSTCDQARSYHPRGLSPILDG